MPAVVGPPGYRTLHDRRFTAPATCAHALALLGVGMGAAYLTGAVIGTAIAYGTYAAQKIGARLR